MWTTPGVKDIIITDAYACEARFAKNNPLICDVCVEVETKDGTESGVWTSEISDKYGVGNCADKTQVNLTVASLMATGWLDGKDPQIVEARLLEAAQNQDYDRLAVSLQSLIGIETQGTVKTYTAKSGEERLELKYIGPPRDWRPKRLGGGVKPAVSAPPAAATDQDADLWG
jgi:hypothetical protein